jgi:hypothetical protein
MTERLKLVDGRLAIESEPKCGTTIHAHVPLNTKVKSAAASMGNTEKNVASA